MTVQILCTLQILQRYLLNAFKRRDHKTYSSTTIINSLLKQAIVGTDTKSIQSEILWVLYISHFYSNVNNRKSILFGSHFTHKSHNGDMQCFQKRKADIELSMCFSKINPPYILFLIVLHLTVILKH